MDDLLRMGFHYRELEAFVRGEQYGLGRKNRSQYRCALANGIRGDSLSRGCGRGNLLVAAHQQMQQTTLSDVKNLPPCWKVWALFSVHSEVWPQLLNNFLHRMEEIRGSSSLSADRQIKSSNRKLEESFFIRRRHSTEGGWDWEMGVVLMMFQVPTIGLPLLWSNRGDLWRH